MQEASSGLQPQLVDPAANNKSGDSTVREMWVD
jgi:hypothetical protein